MLNLDHLTQAVDMTHANTNECFPSTSGGLFVVIHDCNYKVGIHLQESHEGAGDWAAVEISVRNTGERAHVTASFMRAAPIARCVKAATGLAQRQPARKKFGSLTDVYLAGWTSDRRGKKQRTPADYANLARVVEDWHLRGKKPAALAHELVDKHGQSLKTWRNRISGCRSMGMLTAEGEMTHKAKSVLYGPDYEESFKLDSSIDASLRAAAGDFNAEERAVLRRNGTSEAQVQKEAMRAMSELPEAQHLFN